MQPRPNFISSPADLHRPPVPAAVASLMDVQRFSNLTKLEKALALVWRATKRFLHGRARGRPKWEAIPDGGTVTVAERDAF